jgi:hypothetical protein
MIRNKRTTFATCTDSVDTPTVRSDVPRLAAPIVYDITQQDVATDEVRKASGARAPNSPSSGECTMHERPGHRRR